MTTQKKTQRKKFALKKNKTKNFLMINASPVAGAATLFH